MSGKGVFIKRNQVLKLIGDPKLVGNDKHLLRHLTDIFEARNHIEIADIYRQFYEVEKGWKSVNDFYFWVKNNEFTDEDILVADVYLNMVKNRECKKVRLSVFSGKSGEKLLQQLTDWAGDCGQDIVELLTDYFSACIREVEKFNKAIIGKPESMLDYYGWSVFERWVESEGGKESYLKLSQKEEMKIMSERNMLLKLNSLQQGMMENKNIKDYDKIGMDICTLGIPKAYKKWCVNS